MITDSHNHTCHFSSDAQMSISELIKECERINLNHIAITEHFDYDYPHKDSEYTWTFNLNQYSQAFDIWRSLTNKVDLLMGIEFGYQEHIVDVIENTSLSLDFDSVILSNHLLDGRDVYYYPECYHIYSKEELHRKYIESLVHMAQDCNNYNIIGHYDYINRYSKKKDCPVLYSDCPREFDNLFEIIISKEKSLEINTKSIQKMKQKKSEMIMPDAELLQRYKDMGGKMITLGSDSHTSNTIGINFSDTAEYLKEHGFKTNTYFVKRIPHEEAL